MCFAGKLHPPSLHVSSNKPMQSSLNPNSGAAQAADEDAEIIDRERESYWNDSIFVIPLWKTYLKEYSEYVLNNLCSPAPSSGVFCSCEVASHTNASLCSCAMPMWWNYYIIINKLFFLLKKQNVCLLASSPFVSSRFLSEVMNEFPWRGNSTSVHSVFLWTEWRMRLQRKPPETKPNLYSTSSVNTAWRFSVKDTFLS